MAAAIKASKDARNGHSGDPQQPYRDLVRLRHPKRSERALQGSKVAKIELHCIECLGEGTKAAINCKSTGCFLWDAVFSRAKRAEGKIG